jgi:Ni/Fe-hydrogenase subunit HybB-like protein
VSAGPAPSSAAQVDADLVARTQRRAGRGWWILFGLSSAAFAIGAGAVGYLVTTGIGVWGVNRGVAWAFDITNFVFWIGIGHAGTLISAILLLLRQEWRTGVHRAAEMMTIFAIVCAAIFPVIHLGRPWLLHWVLPLPNTRGPLWINFLSPLTWDVVAISTYFAVSALFCWLGLLPDLALMRDASGGRRRRVLAALCLGWDGSQRTWARHREACVLVAALATPLVISVHSVVSFDFAATLVPGWHTTIFPPYFVVGAIFSGMATVLVLAIVMRRAMALESVITPGHLDAMGKVMLAASLLLGFAYFVELAEPLVSGHEAQRLLLLARTGGPLAWAFWTMLACNALVPQLLWLPAVRRNAAASLAIAATAVVGMWLERFVIVVGSLQRDALPATWVGYLPTAFEVATLVGSVGLFLVLFLLFCRFLPVVAVSEAWGERARRERGGEAGA